MEKKEDQEQIQVLMPQLQNMVVGLMKMRIVMYLPGHLSK